MDLDKKFKQDGQQAIDFSRKLLDNRQPRGLIPGNYIWSVFLTLAVLIVGILLILNWADIINTHEKRSIVGLLGLMFFLGGLITFRFSLRPILWEQRAKRLKRTRPAEPWLADFPWWDPSGDFDYNYEILKKYLILDVLALLLTIVFNYGVFSASNRIWVLISASCFIDAVFLGFCIHTIRIIIRSVKFGRSHLRYARFPFFLGETLEVYWSSERPIGTFSDIEITLHLIEERKDIIPDPAVRGGHRSVFQPYELYTHTLPIHGGGIQDSTKEIPLSFQIPENVAGTKLTGEKPRYWELAIQAKTPGVDYKTNFLIPVYARPGTSGLRPIEARTRIPEESVAEAVGERIEQNGVGVKLICPKCNVVIPPQNVNAASGLAYCAGCKESFTLRELTESAEEDVEQTLRPASISSVFERTPGEISIVFQRGGFKGATAFLSIFALIWNAIVWGIIITQFSGWQESNDRVFTAFDFVFRTIIVVIFIIPGLIGLILAYAALFNILGNCAVTLNRDTLLIEYRLFGFSWKRRFPINEITAIEKVVASQSNDLVEYGIGFSLTSKKSPIVISGPTSEDERKWLTSELVSFWQEQKESH